MQDKFQVWLYALFFVCATIVVLAVAYFVYNYNVVKTATQNGYEQIVVGTEENPIVIWSARKGLLR